MTVFMNYFKRNKLNFLIMLVVPIALIGSLLAIFSGGSSLVIGLVDYDETDFTKNFTAIIEENADVTALEEKEIKWALTSGKIDYAIVIDQGFTAAIIENRAQPIRSYSIKGGNIFLPTKIKAESFLLSARNITLAAGGNEALFYQGLENYNQGSFELVVNRVQEQNEEVGFTSAGIGFLAMSMLLLSTFSTILIVQDKENNTFYRVLASPISLKNYMLQSILCFLTLLLLQVGGVIAVMHFIFKLYLGTSLINLLLVLGVYALVCISFGIGLTGIAKSTRQAGAIATMVIAPMSMLGGLFWPREFMPEILQQAGNFLPVTWVMTASNKVLIGEPLAAVAGDIGVMLLFALVFFLLGTWRRVDIAR